MKQIFICSNSVNDIKGLLENNSINNEWFFIFVDAGSGTDAEALLIEKGCTKVNINSGLGGMDFKKEYIDFIGILNRGYNSIYWWANSISFKGTFVYDLSQEIFNYYCIAGLVKNHERNYIILSDNLVLNDSIADYCRLKNISFRRFDTGNKEGRFTFLKRSIWNNGYFICQGWARKFVVSWYLSKQIKKALKKNTKYYVLRSWLNKRSFHGNIYNDLFFGSLPEYLKQNNKEYFVLAGILTDYKNMIFKIKEAGESLIIPQEYFAGYMDYLKALMLTWLNRVKIKKPAIFCGLDVTKILTRCLKKDYEAGEINKNLMYYYYAKGLSKKAKIDTFMFTFENQAWERMSILALKRYVSNARLFGYAHSSITQSQLGYFISKEEQDIVPLPDKIITAGKEPQLILSSNGNYPGRTKLVEGCALRYEYLFKKNGIERHREGNILAAFSINGQYSLKLLEFLSNSLGGIDKYKVVLREHPFSPIHSMMKKRGVPLNDNFSISKASRFEDDLKDAGLFIYIDTTSSIEALMCGIPVIHIDFKEPASPDPLFKLDSLKWTVSEEDELRKVVDYVYGMNNEEYLKKYEGAASYLKNYFYPTEEKYLREFII